MKQPAGGKENLLQRLRRRRAPGTTAVTMRELSRLALFAALVIGPAFLVAWHFVRPAPPDHFIIATGTESGAYHLFAQRYRELLAQEKIRVELRPTSGSVENLKLLHDAGSGVEVALMQGGIAGSDDTEPVLRSLGALYYEPLWVFYRGEPGLDRLPQLAGRRIATGPEGSGTRRLAETLFRESGAGRQRSRFSPLAGMAAAQALRQGHIDAALFVASPAAPVVQSLLKDPEIRLMSLAHAEAYAQRFGYLSAVTLLRGSVDIAADIPSRNVSMVAVTAHLVAREDFHPALVSVLLQAATRVHSGAGAFHRAGEFPAPRGGDFPVSEDAARYYKSGPPLLQRYLPFWVANLLERLLVLLVPLIAVVLPMTRILPAVYDWQIKRKIFRWYRELKAVEIEMQRDSHAGNTAALLTRLNEIERGVTATRVPLNYWDYVYALRGHIDLVRARLGGPPIPPATRAVENHSTESMS
jgi:TRAP transporter TAXI family solute receptor